MAEIDDLDRIAIRGINVLGHHGVDKAERQVGQRLVIDVDLYQNLEPAIANDDIRKTINYEAVCTLVERVAGQEEFLLLESLASEIANRILETFKPEAVTVRVRKMNIPISTRVGSVEVEIKRSRRG